MLATVGHIGLVSVLIVILVAAGVYWLCTALGLPQVVAVILTVIVALVGLGLA